MGWVDDIALGILHVVQVNRDFLFRAHIHFVVVAPVVGGVIDAEVNVGGCLTSQMNNQVFGISHVEVFLKSPSCAAALLQVERCEGIGNGDFVV